MSDDIDLDWRKQVAQRRMATAALVAMIVFTILLFTPIIPDERIKLLADVSIMFYVSMSGIVAAFMGAAAWMSKKG
jgi:hypothetical protein